VIEGEAIEIDSDGHLPRSNGADSPWRPHDGTTR
jgi:hypothetical protein